MPNLNLHNQIRKGSKNCEESDSKSVCSTESKKHKKHSKRKRSPKIREEVYIDIADLVAIPSLLTIYIDTAGNTNKIFSLTIYNHTKYLIKKVQILSYLKGAIALYNLNTNTLPFIVDVKINSCNLALCIRPDGNLLNECESKIEPFEYGAITLKYTYLAIISSLALNGPPAASVSLETDTIVIKGELYDTHTGKHVGSKVLPLTATIPVLNPTM